MNHEEKACLELAEPWAMQWADDTYMKLVSEAASCLEAYRQDQDKDTTTLSDKERETGFTRSVFSKLEKLAREALECQLSLFDSYEIRFVGTATKLLSRTACERCCHKLKVALSVIIAVKHEAASTSELDRQRVFSILEALYKVLA